MESENHKTYGGVGNAVLQKEASENLKLSPEELMDANRYIDLYSAYSRS